MANADCEMPSGLRNSSSNISPGWVGGTWVGSRRLTSGARRLVVVRDFDFVGIRSLTAKTHSVLIIDANTALACAISREPLQAVARRSARNPFVGFSGR